MCLWIFAACLYVQCLPSVLWRCWLGVRKNIHPVNKLSDEVLAWLSVWSEVQMIYIWSSWCRYHSTVSCFIKIQIGLTTFQVVLEKRPLNRCLSVCAVHLWLNDTPTVCSKSVLGKVSASVCLCGSLSTRYFSQPLVVLCHLCVLNSPAVCCCDCDN